MQAEQVDLMTAQQVIRETARMRENFRIHLKAHTDPSHARVDQAFSQMDIASPAGLIAFLSVHAACFTAMASAQNAQFRGRNHLAELVTSIEHDLDALDVPTPPPLTFKLADCDPLALDYILEGSRLGSQVLARRWASSVDPHVLGAAAYFSRKPNVGPWRNVCDRLAQIAVGSARAEKIKMDTCALFDMFFDAAQAHGDVAQPDLEPVA